MAGRNGVGVVRLTFLTSWGEFSPTLEDVAVLLKLPMFGDFDLSAIVLERHIVEMSKALKVATAESAKHSRKKLALIRSHQADVESPSTVKMRLLKGGVLRMLPLPQ
ncbi:hypothetical protein SESBI_04922 [Sesbania bispinosa]|nr:hypothetical protein SESBI_04922 [Sesbania bispinosa]